MFTETLGTRRPCLRHFGICEQTSPSTHSPIGLMRPVSSARLINAQARSAPIQGVAGGAGPRARNLAVHAELRLIMELKPALIKGSAKKRLDSEFHPGVQRVRKSWAAQ